MTAAETVQISRVPEKKPVCQARIGRQRRHCLRRVQKWGQLCELHRERGAIA